MKPVVGVDGGRVWEELFCRRPMRLKETAELLKQHHPAPKKHGRGRAVFATRTTNTTQVTEQVLG